MNLAKVALNENGKNFFVFKNLDFENLKNDKDIFDFINDQENREQRSEHFIAVTLPSKIYLKYFKDISVKPISMSYFIILPNGKTTPHLTEGGDVPYRYLLKLTQLFLEHLHLKNCILKI